MRGNWWLCSLYIRVQKMCISKQTCNYTQGWQQGVYPSYTPIRGMVDQTIHPRRGGETKFCTLIWGEATQFTSPIEGGQSILHHDRWGNQILNPNRGGGATKFSKNSTPPMHHFKERSLMFWPKIEFFSINIYFHYGCTDNIQSSVIQCPPSLALQAWNLYSAYRNQVKT